MIIDKLEQFMKVAREFRDMWADLDDARFDMMAENYPLELESFNEVVDRLTVWEHETKQLFKQMGAE